MFSSPFPKEIGFAAIQRCDQVGKELFGQLHSAEQQLLADSASDKRRNEFSLGRIAAHQALSQLDHYYSEFPILRGQKGQPLWPTGIVGSITHSKDWAIAAVGRTEHSRALGIDLQTLDRVLRVDISRHLCVAEEVAWLKEDEERYNERLLCLFSAKESIYKALFPLEELFLGFKDVSVRWEHSRQVFIARLKKDFGCSIKADQLTEVGCMLKQGYVFTYVHI